MTTTIMVMVDTVITEAGTTIIQVGRRTMEDRMTVDRTIIRIRRLIARHRRMCQSLLSAP